MRRRDETEHNQVANRPKTRLQALLVILDGARVAFGPIDAGFRLILVAALEVKSGLKRRYTE